MEHLFKTAGDRTMNRQRPWHHFLDIADYDSDTLRHIITTARDWKELRQGQSKGALDEGRPLDQQSLAMVFEKPSTRTRISFEMAMQQLGGKSLILSGDSMQLGRGETVEDTARVMSRMVDAIMIRANDHQAVLTLAENASVPVINALTDFSHPCQLMADIMTYEEHRGSVAGKKFAWFGDGNNVATSLIQAAVRFDFDLMLACPEAYLPNPDVLDWAKSEGRSIDVTHDAKIAARGADCMVTDCWVSMGDKDADARHTALGPYQVTEELMAEASSDALFMHCLPAHREEEVTTAVIDGPQSVIWDEAENRLHAQKAILAFCLGKI
ncbi:ornithine carbamoyltransferase [Temperatibacter marinus]|uniref:Ornithine carbamoyltransferase n=1 Tax=Temperatibacter marinus TaxID=1456591 RepID=A0AA52EIP0_9PROT|nr:ornithine carbamoyltransferase [Temperatibacter marinus]WND03252.1 ornithine carbamoyltransferase [Temperatibacter marinus]